MRKIHDGYTSAKKQRSKTESDGNACILNAVTIYPATG